MASGSSAMPAGEADGSPEAPAQSHHQPHQEGGDRKQGGDDKVAGQDGAGLGADASSASASSSPAPATAQAETYEAMHVHAVYEAIAPHFSSTRHKPWPLVAQFLLAQRPGSIGLDVGCGNGKYLRVNPAIHILGSDRSAALVRLAWEGQRHVKPVHDDAEAGAGPNAEAGSGQVDVAIADGLALPHRRSAVDFVISIAVIHHLSTPARRREAIAALLECVRPRDGRVLVYVWALEQSSSRRGWDEGSQQDTLVPWVMRKRKGQGPDETFQRYYHLYRQGELEEDVVAAGGAIEDKGYERDNWWVICSRPS